jgi:hypothetical protein
MNRHDSLIASSQCDNIIALLFFEDTDEVIKVVEPSYRIDLIDPISNVTHRSKRFNAKDDTDAKRKFRIVCQQAVTTTFQEAVAEIAPEPEPQIQEPSAPAPKPAQWGRF